VSRCRYCLHSLVVQRVPSNEGGGEKEALRTIEPVIYCVVPKELEAELYDRLVDYYKDNPNVEVVVDRREGADRRTGRKGGGNREKTGGSPPALAPARPAPSLPPSRPKRPSQPTHASSRIRRLGAPGHSGRPM
jgi:hypothetical protein